MLIKSRKTKRTKEKENLDKKSSYNTKLKNENDLIAVMAASIFLNTSEYHDTEGLKITIKRIDRPYSPWSSKIYMMRKWPRN